MSSDFDPTNVDLTTADPTAVVCFIEAGANEYNGHLGARISALFVILIVSTLATFFPVVAARVKWVRVPIYAYLFARYFGAGVIIATAFVQYVKQLTQLPIHLLTRQQPPRSSVWGDRPEYLRRDDRELGCIFVAASYRSRFRHAYFSPGLPGRTLCGLQIWLHER